MNFRNFCEKLLVHTFPDLSGWQIIGIRHDYLRELIVQLAPPKGERAVINLAHNLAKKLALNEIPDIN